MQTRKTNLYKPDSGTPFNISRSKIALFLECPQCFYLDRRLGISRPDMPGWSLNSAVDHLLKNEFDLLREQKKPHWFMQKHQINAVPFWHPDFVIWRDDYNKKIGASFFHKETNLNICGIIDDIWQNVDTRKLHIVDYKSTSSDLPVSLDGQYKEGYKRQMEVYQWIFKKLGFEVSPTGYFFYVNAQKRGRTFNGKLEFETTIIPYEGNNEWVESAVSDIKKCLDSEIIPESGKECQHCAYRRLINGVAPKTQTII